MIAGKKARLTAELSAAVRNQDLSLTHATRIQENFPGKRIHSGVFRWNIDGEVTEWDPGGFSTPAHVNYILGEWEQLEKRRTSERRFRSFEPSGESKRTRGDQKVGHTNLPLVTAT